LSTRVNESCYANALWMNGASMARAAAPYTHWVTHQPFHAIHYNRDLNSRTSNAYLKLLAAFNFWRLSRFEPQNNTHRYTRVKQLQPPGCTVTHFKRTARGVDWLRNTRLVWTDSEAPSSSELIRDRTGWTALPGRVPDKTLTAGTRRNGDGALDSWLERRRWPHTTTKSTATITLYSYWRLLSQCSLSCYLGTSTHYRLLSQFTTTGTALLSITVHQLSHTSILYAHLTSEPCAGFARSLKYSGFPASRGGEARDHGGVCV